MKRDRVRWNCERVTVFVNIRFRVPEAWLEVATGLKAWSIPVEAGYCSFVDCAW